MSTYSHVSVIKHNAGKSSKHTGKRKNNKQDCGIVAALSAAGNASNHTWYSNKAYPVLTD